MIARAAGICWLVVFYTASARFIEVSLSISAVMPILGRQYPEASDNRTSCSKLCQSDPRCYGFLLSDPGEKITCRFLNFPLCILQDPLHDNQTISQARQAAQRVAIKTSRFLDARHDVLFYPGYSPVFPTGFQMEFIERQVVSTSGKKYVRSAVMEFISDNWHHANSMDTVDVRNLQLSSEIECSSLCKESQRQFGMSCGIAFESIITFSNKRVEICRIFPLYALANLKTLKITDRRRSDPGYEVLDTTMIAANVQVRNDVCRRRWNYQRIIDDNTGQPIGSLTDRRQPSSSRNNNRKKKSNYTSPEPDHLNPGGTNSTRDISNQSVFPVIEKPSFWSRFLFCAVIPASVIVIAVFTSAIACNYSRQKLNRQVAQFWRWQQAGIPSDDFRPADDARDLIF